MRLIEDRQTIERMLLDYGHFLDRRDFAAYARMFAAQGEWVGGTGTFRGPAAIQAGMEKTFGGAKPPTGLPGNFHILTNARIDIDGDKATALSKWTFVRMSDMEPIPMMAGEYVDTLVRENGQWKFLRRDAPAAGAAPAGGVMHLTDQDYTEIGQLSARYAFAIDQCSNAGYDYADLYTPDGEFAVSDKWGGGGKRTFVTTGREALARVAGGRDGKCIDPRGVTGLRHQPHHREPRDHADGGRCHRQGVPARARRGQGPDEDRAPGRL